MAKKQAVSTKTKAAAPVAKPVPPTVAAKPRSPRVSSPRHKAAVQAESIPEPTPAAPAIEIAAPVPAVPARSENPQAAIAKIAYGYWAARGFQGGNPLEDWVRAEREYSAHK